MCLKLQNQISGIEVGEAYKVAAGMTPERIDRLVRDGDLRRGVTGYWLPRPPDPGAMAAMEGAIRSRAYGNYQD